MSGYLEEFGAEEARRELIVKRLVLTAVALVCVAGVVYFLFRDYREERKLKSFIELLQQKDYRSAYALWGCVNGDEVECRDYTYKMFLDDWGPESDHPDIRAGEKTRERSCDGGIIQTLKFGEDDEVYLYVDRDRRVISYAPWPVCKPRLPAGSLEMK